MVYVYFCLPFIFRNQESILFPLFYLTKKIICSSHEALQRNQEGNSSCYGGRAPLLINRLISLHGSLKHFTKMVQDYNSLRWCSNDHPNMLKYFSFFSTFPRIMQSRLQNLANAHSVISKYFSLTYPLNNINVIFSKHSILERKFFFYY